MFEFGLVGCLLTVAFSCLLFLIWLFVTIVRVLVVAWLVNFVG